jgi:hypothetical protein
MSKRMVNPLKPETSTVRPKAKINSSAIINPSRKASGTVPGESRRLALALLMLIHECEQSVLLLLPS